MLCSVFVVCRLGSVGWLIVVCCLSFVVCCVMFSACCVLSVVCSLMFGVCTSSVVVCSLSLVVRSLMYDDCLFYVCWLLCVVC